VRKVRLQLVLEVGEGIQMVEEDCERSLYNRTIATELDAPLSAACTPRDRVTTWWSSSNSWIFSLTVAAPQHALRPGYEGTGTARVVMSKFIQAVR
jgi:hypothetical protein